MNSRATVKLVFLILPLLLGIAAIRLFGRRHTEFETGAFRIVVPGDLNYARHMGEVLSDFTSTLVHDPRLEKFEFHMPDSGGRRITVYLEPRESILRRGFTDAMQDISNNGGFFNPARLEIALEVAGPVKNPGADERILRHEVVHLLIHLSDSGGVRSPWLSEGLATYFETTPSGGVPGEWTAEARALGENLIPLETLLNTRGPEFAAAQSRAFTRQSLLLVAYLFEKRREEFFAYWLLEQRKGAGTVADFTGRFGPLAEFQKGWKDYVLSLK